MDNAAGEDLSWFWNEWFTTTLKLDQAVKSIDYIDNDPSKGALITIENLEGMALPVTIVVKEENGNSSTVKLPAEIWQRGGTWTFAYKSTSKITYATIDPDHVLPDVKTDNNSLSGISMAKGVTVSSVVKAYLDAIGGEQKLKDVSDLTITEEGTVQGYTFLKVSKYKSPDKMAQDVTVPKYNNFSLTHIIISGDSITLKQNGRTAPLSSASERGAVRARYKLFPELDFNKTGYTAKLDTNYQIVNGQLAYLITVTTPDNTSVKYFYDAKTGLKIKQYTNVPNATIMEFSDYQAVNTGVKLPFTEMNSVNGQPIEFKVKSATANTGLTNDAFKQ
jgi:hypothetical protein